jgi:Cys-tRNA(Pro)/Cys-tRNA(Cys) deacylase
VVIATNVTRLLEAKGIPYRGLEIPNKKMNALEVAAYLEVSPETVFKTIVAEREKQGKAILALVPATGEVDLKKLAKAAGEKKVAVTTLENAEKLTGLRAGGISPLALLHKRFEVYLDTSALDLDEIIISGGQWGLQIAIAPQDMMALTRALCEDLT